MVFEIICKILILTLLASLSYSQTEQSLPICSSSASRGPCGCPAGSYCDINPSDQGPPSLFCCSPCEDGSLALPGFCPFPPGPIGSMLGPCSNRQYQCRNNGACCRIPGPVESIPPTGICQNLKELRIICRGGQGRRCPGNFFCKSVGRTSRCCEIPEAPACPFNFNPAIYPAGNCGDLGVSQCPAGFYCVTDKTGYTGRCCPDPFILGLIENPCWYGQPLSPPEICEPNTNTCPDPYNYCEALPNNKTVGVCCAYSDARYDTNCPVGLPLLDIECDKSQIDICGKGFSCVQGWRYDVGSCCPNIFSLGVVANPCPVGKPKEGVFCDYDQQCPLSYTCVNVPGRSFGACCLDSSKSHTTEQTINGKTLICPDDCPRYYYCPVCGSDNATYRNRCYLIQAACLNHDSTLTIKHRGNCPS